MAAVAVVVVTTLVSASAVAAVVDVMPPPKAPWPVQAPKEALWIYLSMSKKNNPP